MNHLFPWGTFGVAINREKSDLDTKFNVDLAPKHLILVGEAIWQSGGFMKNSQEQEIPRTHDPLIPSDPGRVNVIDPLELQYWCDELQCTHDDLIETVAQVGEHVTAVRDQLVSSRATKRLEP